MQTPITNLEALLNPVEVSWINEHGDGSAGSSTQRSGSPTQHSSNKTEIISDEFVSYLHLLEYDNFCLVCAMNPSVHIKPYRTSDGFLKPLFIKTRKLNDLSIEKDLQNLCFKSGRTQLYMLDCCSHLMDEEYIRYDLNVLGFKELDGTRNNKVRVKYLNAAAQWVIEKNPGPPANKNKNYKKSGKNNKTNNNNNYKKNNNGVFAHINKPKQQALKVIKQQQQQPKVNTPRLVVSYSGDITPDELEIIVGDYRSVKIGREMSSLNNKIVYVKCSNEQHCIDIYEKIKLRCNSTRLIRDASRINFQDWLEVYQLINIDDGSVAVKNEAEVETFQDENNYFTMLPFFTNNSEQHTMLDAFSGYELLEGTEEHLVNQHPKKNGRLRQRYVHEEPEIIESHNSYEKTIPIPPPLPVFEQKEIVLPQSAKYLLSYGTDRRLVYLKFAFGKSKIDWEETVCDEFYHILDNYKLFDHCGRYKYDIKHTGNFDFYLMQVKMAYAFSQSRTKFIYKLSDVDIGPRDPRVYKNYVFSTELLEVLHDDVHIDCRTRRRLIDQYASARCRGDLWFPGAYQNYNGIICWFNNRRPCMLASAELLIKEKRTARAFKNDAMPTQIEVVNPIVPKYQVDKEVEVSRTTYIEESWSMMFNSVFDDFKEKLSFIKEGMDHVSDKISKAENWIQETFTMKLNTRVDRGFYFEWSKQLNLDLSSKFSICNSVNIMPDDEELDTLHRTVSDDERQDANSHGEFKHSADIRRAIIKLKSPGFFQNRHVTSTKLISFELFRQLLSAAYINPSDTYDVCLERMKRATRSGAAINISKFYVDRGEMIASNTYIVAVYYLQHYFEANAREISSLSLNF